MPVTFNIKLEIAHVDLDPPEVRTTETEISAGTYAQAAEQARAWLSSVIGGPLPSGQELEELLIHREGTHTSE
jgi:hypothetical protein